MYANEWWNNSSKPDLKKQNTSNTDEIAHQSTKDVLGFAPQEHSPNLDLGLINLLPNAQGGDFEEEHFAKRLKKKKRRL